MSDSDVADSLQHPRRSLGDRYIIQAEKYLNLAIDAEGRLIQDRLVNLEW